MNQPLVCAVCLTADRRELTARAIRSFDAQTYRNKTLVILDTGSTGSELADKPKGICVSLFQPSFRSESIGALRNRANDLAISYLPQKPDLFAHWDSDDWSHPNRLAEQVALIESGPELDAVGYSDMLFWKEGRRMGLEEIPGSALNDGCTEMYTPGEAWLYTSTSSYLLGTSLLYRRAAWERKPFEHVNQGEDRRWLAGLRTKGEQSVRCAAQSQLAKVSAYQPRMIASIHGSNTSSRIDPASENWRRVPEWDAHCRETMALPVHASAR